MPVEVKERKPLPKWARRLLVACVGAALGASCAFLPPLVQPACVAVVKVLHLAGVP